LVSRAIYLRVKEKRARGQVYDRCAGNADRSDISARKARRNGRANVPLPYDGASGRIERINVVGLGYRNDHRRAAGTVFNVKRLGVNVARNRAAKVRVARQAGGGGRGERGIDEQTVSRSIIMMLGDVDRGGCSSRGQNWTKESNTQNENKEGQISETIHNCHSGYSLLPGVISR